MPTKNTVEILITATDQASKVLDQIGGASQTLGKVALAGLAGGAVAATTAVTALAGGIVKLTMDAAAVEGTASTFDKLAESVGGDATTALEQLTEATRGMVADADLMAAGNKFFAMGLAESTEEAAELAEVATQLGSAMGEDATDSMENFALMLANQSIPRLDSFGISSGVVRERINELMAANEGMGRETAFMTAVMEQAAETMDKVGEQGDTAAASMGRISATVENAGLAIGQAFLPFLSEMLVPIADLVQKWGPQLIEVFTVFAEWIGPKLTSAFEKFAGILDSVIDIVSRVANTFIWNMEAGQGLEQSIQSSIGTFLALIGVNQEVGEAIEKVIKTVFDIVDAFGNFWVVLKDYGPLQAIVEVLDSFIPEEQLAPIWDIAEAIDELIKTVAGTIGDLISFKDVLIAVGVGVASVVLPAIAGLVISLASVLAPILLLVATIALLRTAWENDWGGMQTKLTQFWKDIQPLLEQVVEWFEVAIPKAIDILKGAFETIKQVWSTAIQPALEELISAFGELWTAIKELWDAVAPIFAELGSTIAEAFGMGGGDALELSDIIKTVADVIVFAIKAIIVVIELFATILTAVANEVSKVWDKHGDKIVKIVEAIATGFQVAFDTISSIVEAAFKFIEKLVKKFFGNSIIPDGIGKGLDTILKAFNSITAKIEAIWEKFWDAVEKVADTVSKIINSLIEAFLAGVQKVFDIIQAAISGDWQKFWDLLKAFAQSISDAIFALINSFLELVKTTFANIQAIVQAAWDAFWQWLKAKALEISNAIFALVQDFLNRVKEFFAQIQEIVKAAWDAFWQWLREKAQALADAIRQLVENFLTGIKDFFATIQGIIQGAWDAFWQALQSIAQTISDAIHWLIDAWLNGIKVIFETILGAIQIVWDAWVNGLQAIIDIVFPAIQTTIETVMGAIETVINTIVGTSETTGIWGKFKSAFDAIQSVVETVIGLTDTSGIWGAIKTAMEAIETIVQTVIDIFQDLIEKIADLILPDWLEFLINLARGGNRNNNRSDPTSLSAPSFSLPNLGSSFGASGGEGGGAGPAAASIVGDTRSTQNIFNTTISGDIDEQEFYFRVQEAQRV
jgi:phage-related protein